MVTINYRLGALGFLTLGNEQVLKIPGRLHSSPGARERWLERPGDGARLGEGQHRQVQRRPRDGDRVWRVCW